MFDMKCLVFIILQNTLKKISINNYPHYQNPNEVSVTEYITCKFHMDFTIHWYKVYFSENNLIITFLLGVTVLTGRTNVLTELLCFLFGWCYIKLPKGMECLPLPPSPSQVSLFPNRLGVKRCIHCTLLQCDVSMSRSQREVD